MPTTDTPIGDIPPGVDPKLWSEDLVNEQYGLTVTPADTRHLAAFAHALELSDQTIIDHDLGPLSPRSPSLRPQDAEYAAPEWDNPKAMAATSDFAPIHTRVRKRRAAQESLGLTYHLIRWPLLAFFFVIVAVEFGFYVFVRQCVNGFEWLVAWRGHKRVLRRKMRAAKTYSQWVSAAKEMDAYLGFDEWKENPGGSYYDAQLVRRVRNTLARLRAANDTRGLMEALSVRIRPNFAGTESSKMYSETFYGTKTIVEHNIKEVVASLEHVRTATDVTLEEKRIFFRNLNRNYGSSALCLSGGASFGYYHFGVVRALLDSDLLPRVVSGTSAGGLIAALVCTHTNAELKQLIRPELADKITACEDPLIVWIQRWWETGARFSALEWARKAMFMTRGSLTFKEAYDLTGRALNISVVPSDRHSPTILLNHLTAPNCVIWSAIIASAAVPGILNPVVLMSKNRDGTLKPHNLGGSRFKDGSLREDIPLGSLHTQFNCNFPIVSQTNPHIHLFFFASRGSVGRPVAHRKGKGWRGGFILSVFEQWLKLDLSKHFRLIRDLDLMPQVLQSDWSNVFLQRFAGVITLTPRSVVRDWFHLLDDPDRTQLARMIDVGQRVTWPAMRMVHNRMLIERAIYRGRVECRLATQRDRPTNDLAEQLPITSSLPIESDADSAIALRTRQKREVSLEVAMRRRKGLRRPERVDVRAANGGSGNGANGGSRADAAGDMHLDIPPLPSPRSSPARGGSSSIGDTFRNMRSSSMSAFNSLRMPRTSSRLSIARWFGASDSESDGDEDIPEFMRREADPTSNDTFNDSAVEEEGEEEDEEDDDDVFTSLPDTADERL